VELICGAGGDRVQRRLGRDAFVLAEYSARGRDAVDRTPHRVEVAQRGDGGVRVDRERDAESFGCGARFHAAGSFRSNCDVVMLITPVPNVVGEDVGAHPELGHTAVLGRRGQLAVLHGVTVIEPSRLQEQLFDDIEPQVDRHVAVAVHVSVDTPLVERPDHVDQLLWWHHPHTVVGGGLTPWAEIAGPLHLCGEALNRAVEHDL
jgi:hypothetical protein